MPQHQYEGNPISKNNHFSISCTDIVCMTQRLGNISCTDVVGLTRRLSNISCTDVVSMTQGWGNISCTDVVGMTQRLGNISCTEVVGMVRRWGIQTLTKNGMKVLFVDTSTYFAIILPVVRHLVGKVDTAVHEQKKLTQDVMFEIHSVVMQEVVCQNICKQLTVIHTQQHLCCMLCKLLAYRLFHSNTSTVLA